MLGRNKKEEVRKIVVIVGSTAVGKSALAVTLARRLALSKIEGFNGAEIISADSRQVYCGLNVGTGKITKKEMRGVPHHLLDVADPKRQFTVAEYQKLARQKIIEILSRGRLPIICGGTGLYIDALLGRLAVPEVPPNPVLRKKLEKKSSEELFALLRAMLPERAKNIDAKNPRRLVRAIEIALTKKRTLASAFCKTFPPIQSELNGHAPTPVLQNALPSSAILWFGLTLPLNELKRKINRRLFVRIGEYKMVAEVRKLHLRGLSWKRMEALGLEYRYISRYLRGLLTKEEMSEKLQTEIYRYAKRQMTWFKRNKEIKWFRPSQKAHIFAMIKNELGD